MNAIICDVCGKAVRYSKCCRIGLRHTDGSLVFADKDLCDECTKAVVAFLNLRRAVAVGPEEVENDSD